MTFDDQFATEPYSNSCILWADEESFRRVRFKIGPLILQEVLAGGNPVHDQNNRALCEHKRRPIEAACRQAFADRPSNRVELQPIDFQA